MHLEVALLSFRALYLLRAAYFVVWMLYGPSPAIAIYAQFSSVWKFF
ncbi:hypothetical protein PHAMO_10221 [Magnetospirillum molischianum DSM 120]|uniref:Uncharacterized protein n=1 Tax=Magnetospirillum molischianum DSM 120 TaxID=1150626 RepID=H8FN58_MAGML|nr:hypothetical protein PHAMO_10221 [Magnetospirillum molischianum DSM 120]